MSIAPDPREFARVRLRRSVVIEAESATIGSAEIRDVSLGGLYVVGPHPFEPYVECRVWLSLGEPPERRIELRGRVARVDATGFGVEFLEIPTESYGPLQNLIQCNAAATDQVERRITWHAGLAPRDDAPSS
jgi:hypothetical protein